MAIDGITGFYQINRIFSFGKGTKLPPYLSPKTVFIQSYPVHPVKNSYQNIHPVHLVALLKLFH